MELGLSGKKAIINGGSAGLGFASARALASEGAELFISARRAEHLEAACRRISDETGAAATPIVADHSTEAGRLAILQACPDPDILIGTSSPPPLVRDFRAISGSDMRDAVEIGLMSPMLFMQAVVDGMASRGWGRIINIATTAAKYPLQMRILSGGPRAALVNFSVGVAKSVAGRNVTINTMLPALHLTEGTRTIFGPIAEANGRTYEEEIAHQVAANAIPAGRFGNAEDFGALVAFLCSSQAGYVTGQCLVVDGGLSNSLF